MTDVYVHVVCSIGGDASTVRVPFVASERASSLLCRCAESSAWSPPLDSATIARLRCTDAFVLSDEEDSDGVLVCVPAANPGDLFARPSKPVEVYVHGTEQVASLLGGRLVERTVRHTVQNGATRYADLIKAFLGAELDDGIAAQVSLVASDSSAPPLSREGLSSLCSAVRSADDFFCVKAPWLAGKAPKAAARKLSLQDVTADIESSLTLEELTGIVSKAHASGHQGGAIQLCLRQQQRARTRGDAASILLLLADLYAAAKRPAKAADCLREAIDDISSPKLQWPLYKKLGSLCMETKQHQDAVSAFRSAVDMAKDCGASSAETTELMIHLGGAMYRAGFGDQSIGIVQQALGGDNSNDLGVFWMAQFYLDRGLRKDAVTWAIQLLVRTHNKPSFQSKARELFVLVLRTVGSAKCLTIIDEIIPTPAGGGNKDLASAIGHLALIARDHSILDAAVPLYAKAIATGSTPNMVLNYVHTLENDGRTYEALQATQAALKTLGPIAVGGVSCSTVAGLIGALDETSTSFPVPPLVAVERLKRPRDCVRVIGSEVARFTVAETAKSHAPYIVTSGVSPIHADDDAKCLLDPFSLDVLALCFAAVKNLFVLAMVDRLPALLATLYPVYHGANLHKSSIRNEAAYFGTVAQLMQYLDTDVTSKYPDQMEALFVVGDSHALSPSWHLVTVGGQPALTVCGVVTGAKLWHLREASDFYTKHLFERVTNAIPPKSQVLFLLGEIDCREGIVQTCQRGMYDSADEAMSVVVGHYVAVVAEVLRKRGWCRLYVQTPPTSLDVTRRICVEMGAKFVASFAPLAAKSQGRLRIIDLPELLSADKTTLLLKYHLDSTHLNPVYVLDGLLDKHLAE